MEIIVAYAVGERSQEDGWKKLCELVHNTPSDKVAEVLKNMEDDYKAKFDAPLPAAYRSAKSTAMSALKNDVMLVDADGKVIGKTAVSKMCKDARSSTATFDFHGWVNKWNKCYDDADPTVRGAMSAYARMNMKGVM